MAEIKIEKEKTLWPWILIGVVLLGLLLYFLVFRDKDNAGNTDTGQTIESTPAQTATENNATNGGPVADYTSYINGTTTMGLDHNFTNGALIRLANAVQAKAAQTGYSVKADLDRVKALAEQITREPEATTHADSIRRAAGILTTAMENMQKEKFPNLNAETQAVRQAVEGINPSVLTLEQKEAVRNFFDKAGALLQKME